MHLRKATPDDAAAIDAVNCFSGDRLGAIKQGRCVTAIIDEQVAGFVVYHQAGLIGKPFVEYLVVAPSFNRRGIGMALLRAVENELRPCRLFISTQADNTPMLSLLSEQDWKRAGRIDQINNSGEAELFFFRDIAADPNG